MSRQLTWLLLLSAGCEAASVHFPGRPPLTVQAILHEGGPILLEDAVVRVESRDGEEVQEGSADAEGRARFDVPWSRGPYAATVSHPLLAYPMTVVGFDAERPDQQVYSQELPDDDDRVRVGGTAGPVEGRWLMAWPYPGGGGGTMWGDPDRWEVEVPRGQPFTVSVIDGESQVTGDVVERTFHGWTHVDHPGTELELTDLHADLSGPVDASVAPVEARFPEASPDHTAYAWVVVGESGAICGLPDYVERLVGTGYELSLTWWSPAPEDVHHVEVMATRSDDSRYSSCRLPGTPDQLEGPVELLPIPALERAPRVGQPLVFADVPADASPVVYVYAPHSWEVRWLVRWVEGSTDLWLPRLGVEERMEADQYLEPGLIRGFDLGGSQVIGCAAYSLPVLLDGR